MDGMGGCERREKEWPRRGGEDGDFYQSQTSSPVLGSENPSAEKHF